MTKTVILIDHKVGRRDDRASALLAQWGHRLQWVRPADGEALPDPRGPGDAVIVYGGAESANDDDELTPYIGTELAWIERWLATGKPYLGFCLGGQMLARVLGGTVTPHPEGHYEIGYVPIRAAPGANGFLGELEHVYHWHKEGFSVPAEAMLLATGAVFPNQAFLWGERAYALQFHPEVTRGVMTRWLDEAGYMLENPNAQPRARQLADAERFDARLATWLDRFLRDWLDGA